MVSNMSQQNQIKQNYWKVYKMNTTLPILIHSVIGGIGEHPDAKNEA